MVAARFLPRFAKRLRETVRRFGRVALELCRVAPDGAAAGPGAYQLVAVDVAAAVGGAAGAVGAASPAGRRAPVDGGDGALGADTLGAGAPAGRVGSGGELGTGTDGRGAGGSGGGGGGRTTVVVGGGGTVTVTVVGSGSDGTETVGSVMLVVGTAAVAEPAMT